MVKVRELDILIGQRFAGRISKDSGGHLHLVYDDEYMSWAEATPLSVSMPLEIKRHGDKAVRPWLAGLLPDDEAVLKRWATHYQIGANPFALLSTPIGRDCAGAVQFLPTGSFDNSVFEGKIRWLSTAEVSSRLRELRSDSTAWLGEDFEGRFSLAGAQSKIALYFDGANWGLPTGSAATSHILKPGINGLSDHEVNEYMCLRAAGAVGLPVANSSISTFEDQQVLVVERYDRVELDGKLMRVHQEDLCQALSVDPSMKYQSDGGPTPVAIAGLLRDVFRPNEAEDAIRRFVDALIFNWVIAGTDAHGKNYSLLLHRNTVRLAPLYDIASALPYARTEHKLKLAMKLGSDYYVNTERPQLWATMARNLSLDESLLRDRAHNLAQAIPDAFLTIGKEKSIADLGSGIPQKLIDRIGERSVRCAKVAAAV